jgi:hypothetical protein
MLSARVDFNVGVELADVVDTCLVVRYEISAVVSSDSLTHLLIEKDKMKEASLAARSFKNSLGHPYHLTHSGDIVRAQSIEQHPGELVELVSALEPQSERVQFFG